MGYAMSRNANWLRLRACVCMDGWVGECVVGVFTWRKGGGGYVQTDSLDVQRETVF